MRGFSKLKASIKVNCDGAGSVYQKVFTRSDFCELANRKTSINLCPLSMNLFAEIVINHYLANMLSRTEIETKLRKLKPQLTNEFHVSSIGYFGSFATDEQSENSDLDLLVEFSKPIGWKFFTLERFLEQSFGIPIVLITKNALKERIREPLLNQVSYI